MTITHFDFQLMFTKRMSIKYIDLGIGQKEDLNLAGCVE